MPSQPAPPAVAPVPPRGGDRRRECVTLVHGFLANKAMLALLAHRLGRRGFAPRCWGYRNMFCSILAHAERFAAELQRLDGEGSIDTIHLVTHSMGGIVARAALDRYRPRKLGRLVMLAPPNRGSFVATAAARTFGGLFRPVAELTTAPDSLVNSLGVPAGVEIGVIAAGHDALVSADATRPGVPHDHVTLPCLHSSLLFRRDAADLVAAFLTSGSFPPTPPAG